MIISTCPDPPCPVTVGATALNKKCKSKESYGEWYTPDEPTVAGCQMKLLKSGMTCAHFSRSSTDYTCQCCKAGKETKTESNSAYDIWP